MSRAGVVFSGLVLAGSSLVGVASCGASLGAPPPVHPALSSDAPPVAMAPASDPPTLVEGDVTVAWANGIQIIVQRVPGAAFAAGQLYVRGGARNWTAQNAGIEQIAFQVASSGGTTSLDKVAYSRRLASLGAAISGDAHADFSGLYLKAPVAAWDDAFGLLVDTFKSPAFPESETELVRTQLLAQLHHEQESPDDQAWTLERKQIFAGHPYQNRPVGTFESVSALRPSDVAQYWARLHETSRLLFVAAGDLDPAHVVAQVRQALRGLPRGSYVDAPLPPLDFGAPHLVTLERKLPTNYCLSAFPSPRWSDPDWVTGLVTVGGYSFRLWQEVRTKRNLSYAVDAYVNMGFATPFALMSVSAVDANAAMRVMLDEARRLQSEPVGAEELAGFKAVFLTGTVERHETPDGQAGFLADAQLHGGDWRLARDFPERVRAVTAADVQAYAKKYFGHLQSAVVGDPGKIDRALFTSF